MLIIVLVTFVVTWLPSVLMDIIRYHHKAEPPGGKYFKTFFHKVIVLKMCAVYHLFIENNLFHLLWLGYVYTSGSVYWNRYENGIMTFLTLLTFVNSCLNPVFYAFMSK